MITVYVHRLQHDFAALEERVRGIHQLVLSLSTSMTVLEDELHKLDKALVARIATITVTERMLWALAMAALGLVIHFLPGGPP